MIVTSGQFGQATSHKKRASIDEDEAFKWYSNCPVAQEGEDLLDLDNTDKLDVPPSRFTEFAIKIPAGGELKSFNFEERRYLRPIYDTSHKRLLLKAGRQVEKSSYVGNRILTYCSLIPYFRSLYVSPSNTQTKVFSRDRVKEPIEVSPEIRSLTNTKLLSNILEKKFINGSQITMRFAFLNADRVRGVPADMINIDELQDVLLDNIPVIEECASHSSYKLHTYSGTPKSLDGTIEHYWSKFSTQNEWVVPCRHHGTPKNKGSWHWNILAEDNIGKEGLICDKCGEPIHPMDPDAQWASLNPKPRVEKPFEGYRIPQLMVPWVEWDDILHKQRQYSRAKFYNEVLGLSYDSGTRPLTRQDVRDNCWSKLSMQHYLEVAEKYSSGYPVFMGIDWSGGSENAFTVVCLAAYLPITSGEEFVYFYFKRFEGLESEPEVQIREIMRLIDKFNVSYVGADYGGGFWPNDTLVRQYGAEKIKKYQWVGNVKRKIKWDPQLGVPRYVCHRTEVMSDYFNAVKRRDVFRYPRWEEFEEPFAGDFLNIFSEYNDRLRMDVYKHAPGCPDDSFHSALFCFLASFHFRKRPDIITPVKELDKDSGEKEEWDIDR